MTISAQVIDTIVGWIDDNLHQPLRIDDIARHAGYSKWHLQRLFLQYKGESLGRYIRERKLLLAARDLRDTDQRVYDICLKYGFDSQQPLPVSSPAPLTSRRVLTVKKITAARTEKRPPGDDRRTFFLTRRSSLLPSPSDPCRSGIADAKSVICLQLLPWLNRQRLRLCCLDRHGMRRLSGLALKENQRRQTQRSADIQWRPALKTTGKRSGYKAG
jgi:AraC family multidrug resistance transcriptional activator